jgi:hypothetical protein
MQIQTDARNLTDTINGISGGGDIGDVEDALRAPLAAAFAALARLVNTSGHDVTLLADINANADAATLSIVTGVRSRALTPDTPWQNPHLSVIDHERQAKAKALAAEVEAERKAADKASKSKVGAGGRSR